MPEKKSTCSLLQASKTEQKERTETIKKEDRPSLYYNQPSIKTM
jgi:hypothetical protein